MERYGEANLASGPQTTVSFRAPYNDVYDASGAMNDAIGKDEKGEAWRRIVANLVSAITLIVASSGVAYIGTYYTVEPRKKAISRQVVV